MTIPRIRSISSHIHALAATLRLDDCEYRDMLHDLYGKRSSKELTPLQQAELAGILQKQLRARNGGKWNDFKRSNPAMATPRQLRAVEAMWGKVSCAETAEGRKQALLKFCERITGRERLEWLKKTDVRKLIKAMEAMGADAPERFKAKNA
jgi:phage gp16-like protein